MTSRSWRRLELAAAIVAVTVAAGHTQQADRRQLVDAEIDRIFKDRAYDPPRFGPARWLPDGSGYAIVERHADGGADIVRYDAATGARSVLVAASALVPTGARKALDVSDYAWSSDGKRLLIFTNTQKVWRQNTRGDYWVLDVAGGTLTQLGVSHAGRDKEPNGLMFAKFSPDGSSVAYVRANNLYVERLKDGKVEQLTRDGSDTIVNGTSDWVYEEELGVRDGFRWSPDGRRIAYWQFDTSRVGIFSLIDDTSALYPSIVRIPYPKAGTINSAVRIGVVSAGGGSTKWMRAPGDPRDSYLASLEWIDNDAVAMQQLNRLQNRNDYLLGDANSGAVTRAFQDVSRTWLDAQDTIVWLDQGHAFLWVSERDGWRHVYRVQRPAAGAASADAGTLMTRFEGDVMDVVGTDDTQLYFVASPSIATDRYLYSAPLDGSKPPVRVTPGDQAGTHSYDLAPAGRLAFHTSSAFERAPRMDVVELPSHRSLRVLTDPSALQSKTQPLFNPPAELLTVDVGGGVVLDGWMIKPPSFDASRKYPVIVHVYGEPAGLTVTNRWGGRNMLFHRALASAGYIVASFDNRGTPAPKGAAWRKVVYGAVGDLSSREQAAAIRALAAKYSYIDSSRIGIWGWSGGGSNTLNAMFRFPDVYSVGVSVAPVPDQRLYDTIYQERYMGLPEENADGYRLGSPINFAEGLKGTLLVVHGSGDDNVHYQGTERLVNRLVELGKPFDLMVYPNRTHSISEGPGTTPHIYHLIARYFLDHLPPAP